MKEFSCPRVGDYLVPKQTIDLGTNDYNFGHIKVRDKNNGQYLEHRVELQSSDILHIRNIFVNSHIRASYQATMMVAVSIPKGSFRSRIPSNYRVMSRVIYYLDKHLEDKVLLFKHLNEAMEYVNKEPQEKGMSKRFNAL